MEEKKPISEVIQRIAFECQESGATKWEVVKVIKELESFEGGEKQLRRKAAETLEKLNPEAAKTFISFEELKVFTSHEKLESFDRGNIIKSLLKETGISRHVAEKIGSEVEDKIKDLKIGYLNTHIIREMVNVKLLEYGHEPIHSQYVRLGLPVFEVKKRLNAGLFEDREILREYNWLSAITKDARELHFNGTIHVYGAEDFSTKTFAHSEFFAGEKTYATPVEAAKLDRFCTNPVTLKAFNFSIAPEKPVNQRKLREEILETEKIFSITGKRCAELALFSGYEWEGLSKRKENATAIAAMLLSSNPKEFELSVSIDSKYQLKLLEKNGLNNALVLNNSSEKTTAYQFGVLTGNADGVLQLTAINLEKIALESGNEGRFIERLEIVAEKISGLCEKKKEELKARPYFEEWMLLKSLGAVSLAGMQQCAETMEVADAPKLADDIIALIHRHNLAAMEMPPSEAERRFGLHEDRKLAQEMLFGMRGTRQKRKYGFVYAAETMKEALELLNDCPAVKLSLKDDSS